MAKFQGFSAQFVIVALIALVLTGLTAWLIALQTRQLMGALLVVWIVGIYVAVAAFDRFRRS